MTGVPAGQLFKRNVQNRKAVPTYWYAAVCCTGTQEVWGKLASLALTQPPPGLNARMSRADLLFSNEKNQLKQFVMQFLIKCFRKYTCSDKVLISRLLTYFSEKFKNIFFSNNYGVPVKLQTEAGK